METIEQVIASEMSKKRRWYNSYTFPIIPQLTTHKGDEYNTRGFSFSWLFFKFWTLDSFMFEFAFVADTHWGIGFVGIIPYLRWVVCVPCPVMIGMWINKHLDRKPKSDYDRFTDERLP